MGIQPCSLGQRPLIAVALIAALFVSAAPAYAGAADKVYEVKAVKGEMEFEFRGGYEDADSGGNPYQAVFDVGYAVSDRWLTELVVKYDDAAPGHDGRISALEWENVVALTEVGRYWMDLGLFSELVYKLHDDLWKLEMGPMFQKSVGSEQFNANLVFERELKDGADTEVVYRGQWKHRAGRALEYGLQVFGDMGTFEHFGRADEHKLGPALFGTVPVGGNNKWAWDVAVLAGLNRSAPDLSLRFEIEFESYR